MTSRKEELRKVTYGTFSLTQEFRKIQALRKDYDRTAFDILILISSRKRMRPSDIAAALQLNPSSITRRMQALLQEGLVSAEIDPSDQRSSLIALTQNGEEALERYFVRSVDTNDRLLENWSDEELKAFASMLSRYSEALKGWRLGQHPEQKEK
ncbi:hypothetical protein PA598K_00613 [Paenibacillus sp. 598K]|uniref:MarR family winged helix-turn-helix transcriptional regulator n=1 Tax=Paenibacillus sp. 598K TaxID=1117987 RepID=UPI000FFAB042|nr:MarR family transcriptional regulator [Paenibacillus sp. 598K]GBF72364.1 hypothetical protein PA598K_00613 [Paenibacillus sp. 598K]